MLGDQRLDLRQWRGDRIRRGDRTAGHKAHHRPHQQWQIRLVENAGLEGAPHSAGKHEVMVVVKIFRDGHAHQQIEDLDRRGVLPEPLEEMVRVVPLATRDRHKEGRFGRLKAAGIHRRKLQQLVRPHRRVVNVLVRERHVLQHRDKTLLALQALDQLRHRVQACQGVQRAAVVTRRHFGGARHREGRGCQHGLRRYPGTQLVQGTIQNLTRRRFLDKLDQRFDGIGKLNTLRHGGLSVSAVRG